VAMAQAEGSDTPEITASDPLGPNVFLRGSLNPGDGAVLGSPLSGGELGAPGGQDCPPRGTASQRLMELGVEKTGLSALY
jgi:hypothetical protein